VGAGLIGAPMAIDLNKDERFRVTVADYSDDALNSIRVKCPELSVIQKDLSNPENVIASVSDYDLVVNAVQVL
jgi:lysine 6-dehydrogenase